MTIILLIVEIDTKLTMLRIRSEQAVTHNDAMSAIKDVETKIVEKVSAVDPYNDITWSTVYRKLSSERIARYGVATKPVVFNAAYVTWDGGERISRKELSEIVRNTFRLMPHIKTNNDVISLLVETAISESDGGRLLGTKGDHGVFQIRVSTADSLLRWLVDSGNDDIAVAISNLMKRERSLKWNLRHNVPFSAAIAVTEYWRKAGAKFSEHISTVEERGVMWKSVYNTRNGLGTVNKYVSRVKTYK